jgi:hypothetical protein
MKEKNWQSLDYCNKCKLKKVSEENNFERMRTVSDSPFLFKKTKPRTKNKTRRGLEIFECPLMHSEHTHTHTHTHTQTPVLWLASIIKKYIFDE